MMNGGWYHLPRGKHKNDAYLLFKLLSLFHPKKMQKKAEMTNEIQVTR